MGYVPTGEGVVAVVDRLGLPVSADRVSAFLKPDAAKVRAGFALPWLLDLLSADRVRIACVMESVPLTLLKA